VGFGSNRAPADGIYYPRAAQKCGHSELSDAVIKAMEEPARSARRIAGRCTSRGVGIGCKMWEKIDCGGCEKGSGGYHKS
jgi:hypothetical protein